MSPFYVNSFLNTKVDILTHMFPVDKTGKRVHAFSKAK